MVAYPKQDPITSNGNSVSNQQEHSSAVHPVIKDLTRLVSLRLKVLILLFKSTSAGCWLAYSPRRLSGIKNYSQKKQSRKIEKEEEEKKNPTGLCIMRAAARQIQ